MRDPAEFSGGYKSLNVLPKELGGAKLPAGVRVLEADNTVSGKRELQTVRFDKKLWPEARAEKWLAAHPELERVSTGEFGKPGAGGKSSGRRRARRSRKPPRRRKQYQSNRKVCHKPNSRSFTVCGKLRRIVAERG